MPWQVNFWFKGFQASTFLVCTYPKGQADILNTTQFLYRKWNKYPEICKWCNKYIYKENVFQIIKSMMNNVWHSNICYNLLINLFWGSQKLHPASKKHELLAWHSKLVRKLMLVPDFNFWLSHAGIQKEKKMEFNILFFSLITSLMTQQKGYKETRNQFRVT